MAWDSPLYIIGMFVAAIGIASWLIRAANPARRKTTFVCEVCGRKQRGPNPAEWRYCPYCGVPKDSRRLADLPPKRSVLDL